MIDRIHHVAVVVRDADAALGFFRDTMGLEVTEDRVLEDQGIRGVLLALGENEIELVQPVQPDTGVARYLESRGERLHHVCFRTDDIEGELARLQGLGVELIDATPREGMAGRIAFIHPKEMHGVLIELAQPPAGAHTSDAKGIDHLAFLVQSDEAARATWKRNLGLEVRGEVIPEGRGTLIAQVPCGQCTIELISPTSVESPMHQRLADIGEGASSMIAIEVPDIASEIARYRAAGLTLRDAAPGPLPHSVTSSISAEQTYGLAIQLIRFDR